MAGHGRLTLALFAGAALVWGGTEAWDRASRYLSWRSLSAEKLAKSTQWYIDNRIAEPDQFRAVCVYAVECSSGRARLESVPALEAYDFEALRTRIWARKFEGACPGRTANLGLELIPVEGATLSSGPSRAFWFFPDDRFHPVQSRAGGGSFSEEPWQRCAPATATFSISGGRLQPARP